MSFRRQTATEANLVRPEESVHAHMGVPCDRADPLLASLLALQLGALTAWQPRRPRLPGLSSQHGHCQSWRQQQGEREADSGVWGSGCRDGGSEGVRMDTCIRQRESQKSYTRLQRWKLQELGSFQNQRRSEAPFYSFSPGSIVSQFRMEALLRVEFSGR